MKNRVEVANYINSGQCVEDAVDTYADKYCWHFGKQDLKMLMDFIYEGKPLTTDEHITNLEPD